MNILAIATTVLSIVLIFFHCIGIYLLKQDLRLNTKFFLMSLSFIEILRALCGIAFSNTVETHKLISEYVIIVGESTKIPYYLSMIWLTLDRFFEIFLALSYESSWYWRHKKLLVVLSWVPLVVEITIWSILQQVDKNAQLDGYYVKSIISVVFNALVVIEFIGVYGYILSKILMHRGRNIKLGAVPFLVMLTYILFNGIPEVVLVAESDFLIYAVLLWRINSLFDALIYIFIQKSIRQRFFRTFRQFKSNSVLPNQGQISSDDENGTSSTNVISKKRRKSSKAIALKVKQGVEA